MFTIRGAITVEKNKEKNILDSTKLLIENIILLNNLKNENIVGFIFSTTDDLDKIYPGKAVREMGFVKTSIMCMQEMNVKESLKKCIRVMVLVNGNCSKDDIKHIYLKNAAGLRKDLNFLSGE